jgi:mannose-1-phosphate guanylyltransferase
LAGGRGERFWPLSRASSPKQLLPIVGRKSLLEQTVSRITPLVTPERIFIITSKHLEKDVAQKLAGFRGITLIGEPLGKNTAPAIGLASTLVSMIEPDAVTLVLPSDHVVKGRREFISDLKTAVRAAQSGRLVVFGVKPDRPETGYGYIEVGGRVPHLGRGVFAVQRFVEKPDHKNAVKLCRSGSHYWNSGMFVWRVDILLDALKRHLPSLAASLKTFGSGFSRRTLRKRLERFYSSVEAISIDYGLLEKSSNIVMVRASFSWDDLGSWLSLERVLSKDNQGNVLSGATIPVDTRNCVLFADSGVIATLGVEDLVVVRTGSATLVCAKKHAQEMKRISKVLSSSRKLKRHL